MNLTPSSNYAAGTPATVTVVDGDLPTITVSATTPNASETGPTNGVYTFTRGGTYRNGSGDLTVNYAMTGTATNGIDYNTLYGWMVIPAGQTTATVTLTPIDDTIMEGSETAILTLASESTYTVGTPSSGTVTIADNDSVTIPNAPTNLVATARQPRRIGLTWTDTSSNETNFRVYRSSDNSTWGSYYAQLGANVTSYTDNSRRAAALRGTTRSSPTTRPASPASLSARTTLPAPSPPSSPTTASTTPPAAGAIGTASRAGRAGPMPGASPPRRILRCFRAA